MLTEASEFTKSKQLTGLVGDVSHMDFAEPSLDLVRNLDVMARQRVRADLEGAECLWLLARLVEYVLSMKHRPFCKFCFRTVAVRSNGRLKDFCPMHASGTSSRDTAAYQRGRKHQADLEAYLEKLPKLSKGRGTDKLPHLDFLEWRLLSFQLNAFRKGGGSAGYIVTHLDWDAWIVGAPLNIDELRLPEIADDHPDWSELAWRWRALFEDHEGVQQLGKGGVAVTPRMLVEQWLRWKAWMVAGDHGAQVGKGRPAKINREEALRATCRGHAGRRNRKKIPDGESQVTDCFILKMGLGTNRSRSGHPDAERGHDRCANRCAFFRITEISGQSVGIGRGRDRPGMRGHRRSRQVESKGSCSRAACPVSGNWSA